MYNLKLKKVVNKINNRGYNLICLQLPDGLKKYSKDIQTEIKKQTGSEIIIWGGSCFGACDLPLVAESLGVDLLIQWGHSEWR
ncbi:hypothetical protein GF327_09340 [Candidatus Woesearchaeota archaeon]|nr:hypothetical protein [Candidatus Woesearchaeota archaeon]